MTKAEATAVTQRTHKALSELYRLQQAMSRFFPTQEGMKEFYDKHLKSLELAVIEIRDMAAAE
jgi:hypothetical protein